jgi:hypothetical protein
MLSFRLIVLTRLIPTELALPGPCSHCFHYVTLAQFQLLLKMPMSAKLQSDCGQQNRSDWIEPLALLCKIALIFLPLY